jgi:hypothetical protein
MFLTLALLLGATPALENLDFTSGTLKHWQGEGFALVKGRASSADTGGKGRTALLHRTFTVPHGAVEVHFSAALVRPAGLDSAGALDVVLEAANRQFLPRHVRQGERWVEAQALLPAEGAALRRYRWDVSKHNGRRVRIALVDSDARPGCHVVCTGFEVVTQDDLNAQAFAAAMRELEGRHKLRKMVRHDSKHFLALSNADPAQTEYRLDSCETIHALFFKHFRKRGFEVRVPPEKLMVAVFNTQAGFEAYLNQTNTAVTGVYHPGTNRLVVYDYATNRHLKDSERRLEQEAKRGASDMDRTRRSVAVGRWVRDHRDDTNLSTMMHEVAHQLSFNGGLLERKGDVPVWLAEGLAVYCESTVAGAWQGLGEPNPRRASVLAGPARGTGAFLPLRALVENDNWIRKATRVNAVLLGYSQSWALFRMLMEDRPARLKAYLETVRQRRTPEHRLADFAAAFGSDLAKLERRYQAYLRRIVKDEGKR